MAKPKSDAPVQTAGDEEDEIVELPERYHLEGCPADPDDLEWETREAVAGPLAGQTIDIIRCVRCGGQFEKPSSKE